MVLSRALIKTMVQWRALMAIDGGTLASTICHCLNFQQELKRDEKPEPKSHIDIEGKKYIIRVDVSCDYDTKNYFSYLFRK